jgi:hypothetical protein
MQVDMAFAYFINATPIRMAVNLNAAFHNHPLQQFDITKTEPPDYILKYESWPARISAFPDRNVFGADRRVNAVTVFIDSHTAPLVYNVRSAVSTTMDLYFYVRSDSIIGVDMTGDSSQIHVTPWTEGAASELKLQGQIRGATPLWSG